MRPQLLSKPFVSASPEAEPPPCLSPAQRRLPLLGLRLPAPRDCPAGLLLPAAGRPLRQKCTERWLEQREGLNHFSHLDRRYSQTGKPAKAVHTPEIQKGGRNEVREAAWEQETGRSCTCADKAGGRSKTEAELCPP
ncbi:hypothetical protein SKAU_G00007110 [Synaphobranchus kaupii]|uniref:Uncharacterized protein n=1 Tax=Synaphobranchus kaupii TaxID=118154 RepID=A0A9Q1JBT2_SYNKA|nr:hypothetical protein SKAU_G00007110 [Synaphobranchus kaupii]